MSDDLVLDTGALVALEREPTRLRTFIRKASEENLRLRAPAPTLSVFLGNAPKQRRRSADHLASGLTIDPVDEAMARRAAALTRVALDQAPKTRPSAIDALGIARAEALDGLLVFDGDRADFEALAAASGAVGIQALSELA